MPLKMTLIKGTASRNADVQNVGQRGLTRTASIT